MICLVGYYYDAVDYYKQGSIMILLKNTSIKKNRKYIFANNKFTLDFKGSLTIDSSLA